MRSRKRFVLSIKTECLNKIIPLGEKHLRLLIKEYMQHYHTERNHQGLSSSIIHAKKGVGRNEGLVKTLSCLLSGSIPDGFCTKKPPGRGSQSRSDENHKIMDCIPLTDPNSASNPLIQFRMSFGTGRDDGPDHLTPRS